jgi:FKBP-type peptidyl-prolyl cis-trans isomerase (trigger factor)
MSGSENPKPTHPVDVEYPRSLTRAEKDALIRSMISSMQLEGIEISREVADRALERALRRPVPEILD